MINVILDADGAWPDLGPAIEAGRLVHLRDTPGSTFLSFARITKGMTSGRSSIMVRVDLPDGRIVIAECSARVFLMAVAGIRAAEEGLE